MLIMANCTQLTEGNPLIWICLDIKRKLLSESLGGRYTSVEIRELLRENFLSKNKY
jgi:hypothetical protein